MRNYEVRRRDVAGPRFSFCAESGNPEESYRILVLPCTREKGLQDKDMGVSSADTQPQQRCGKCGETLVLRPVPGAKTFPRRLECPTHGWEKETVRAIRMRFHKDRPDW
jgi:hypothetical protein